MKRLMILVVVGFLGSLTTSAFAGNNGKSNNSEHFQPSSMHYSSEHCEKTYCPPCQTTYCPPCQTTYCPPCEKTYCPPCQTSCCEKNWCETNYCFHDCTCDSYYDCFYDSSASCYCYYDCNHECHHCDKSHCCDKSYCHDSKSTFKNTIHPIIYHGPTKSTPVNTIHPIPSPVVRDHRSK